MIYKGYTNKYPLPDRNLSLYSIESFVLSLQKEGLILGRSPSARITRNQQPQYCGADAAPAGPAFTHFVGFEQANPSQPPAQQWSHHLGWEEQPMHEHGESSQALPGGLVILVLITLIHRNYLQQENSRGHAHPFLPGRPMSTIREGHFFFIPLHRTTTTRTHSSTFSSLMSQATMITATTSPT
jgi:hypothetical protein